MIIGKAELSIQVELVAGTGSAEGFIGLKGDLQIYPTRTVKEMWFLCEGQEFILSRVVDYLQTDTRITVTTTNSTWVFASSVPE